MFAVHAGAQKVRVGPVSPGRGMVSENSDVNIASGLARRFRILVGHGSRSK